MSPDDIWRYWDAPDNGGFYGHSEPLVYRNGEHIRVSKWEVSEGVGTLDVTVLDISGNVVEGATIEVAGIDGSTDTQGKFRDERMPSGTYEIYAYKILDGYFQSKREAVTITADSTTIVLLQLELPPQFFRSVRVTGRLYIKDDEIRGSNSKTFDVNLVASVDIYQRSGKVEFEECQGGEVTGVIAFEFYLSEVDDTSVELRTVQVKDASEPGHLFGWETTESTECQRKDQFGTGRWHPPGQPDATILLPADETYVLSTLRLVNNEDISGGDVVEAELSVFNDVERFR